ncbi:MAG: hypothetical protein Q9166_007640 [cf. Caloplaca sp. 2 TL-2023]
MARSALPIPILRHLAHQKPSTSIIILSTRFIHHSPNLASSSPFYNLGGLSTSREAQFLSRERGIPRTEYSPQSQLIRASEVEPYTTKSESSVVKKEIGGGGGGGKKEPGPTEGDKIPASDITLASKQPSISPVQAGNQAGEPPTMMYLIKELQETKFALGKAQEAERAAREKLLLKGGRRFLFYAVILYGFIHLATEGTAVQDADGEVIAELNPFQYLWCVLTFQGQKGLEERARTRAAADHKLFGDKAMPVTDKKTADNMAVAPADVLRPVTESEWEELRDDVNFLLHVEFQKDEYKDGANTSRFLRWLWAK